MKCECALTHAKQCILTVLLIKINIIIIGNVSEWTKCTYVTQNPKRRQMVVPSQYMDTFKKFKSKVDVREFMAAPPPPVLLTVKSEAGPR